MEITKALCLSTIHVRQSTARWLDSVHDDAHGLGPFTVWEASHGYFIPVAILEWKERVAEVPAELIALLNAAKAAECDFLRLDSDGPDEAEFPTFDWEEPDHG